MTPSALAFAALALAVAAAAAVAYPTKDEEAVYYDGLRNLPEDYRIDPRNLDATGGNALLNDLARLRERAAYLRRAENMGLKPAGGAKSDDVIGNVKRNMDEIDRSSFNSFVKKNFDEIDRSGFGGFVKRNFDEIDRSGFGGFVKKNALPGRLQK